MLKQKSIIYPNGNHSEGIFKTPLIILATAMETWSTTSATVFLIQNQ